ncbi:hypothetical protein K491DRAFT_418306 [Lophiostoma macrostomum CBS 122681]|uniref:Uncharacterized protein n=1 Tax=Lophiostoma macrostomum CBS 122681 TaxID=1314788 RepID=A0A6A6TQF3_9PLEO|nr:hypothetical protein K491DRAFT_418306 [Lophiostoma macrostomum CBS 122681]
MCSIVLRPLNDPEGPRIRIRLGLTLRLRSHSTGWPRRVNACSDPHADVYFVSVANTLCRIAIVAALAVVFAAVLSLPDATVVPVTAAYLTRCKCRRPVSVLHSIEPHSSRKSRPKTARYVPRRATSIARTVTAPVRMSRRL